MEAKQESNIVFLTVPFRAYEVYMGLLLSFVLVGEVTVVKVAGWFITRFIIVIFGTVIGGIAGNVPSKVRRLVIVKLVFRVTTRRNF